MRVPNFTVTCKFNFFVWFLVMNEIFESNGMPVVAVIQLVRDKIVNMMAMFWTISWCKKINKRIIINVVLEMKNSSFTIVRTLHFFWPLDRDIVTRYLSAGCKTHFSSALNWRTEKIFDLQRRFDLTTYRRVALFSLTSSLQNDFDVFKQVAVLWGAQFDIFISQNVRTRVILDVRHYWTDNRLAMR